MKRRQQIKGYLYKPMSLILGLCLMLSSCSEADMELHNNFINVLFKENKISISSVLNEALKIPEVNLYGTVTSCEKNNVSDDLWGSGEQLKFKHGGNRITTFSLYTNNPYVQIQTTIQNDSTVNFDVLKLEIATLDLSIGNKYSGLNTLGTGGLKPIDKAEGSYTYSVLANPENRNSIVCGWLTQFQGIGIMEPKLEKLADKQVYSIKTSLDFGHYKVDAGTERGTDILVLGFFNDGREGLEIYGDQLAKVYDVNLPEKPEVYCTWYHRKLTGSGASNEKYIKANAEFSAKNLKPFGLNVMQIDDHWQDSMVEGIDFKNRKSTTGKTLGNGPIKTFVKGNSNFPNGMKAMAKTIKRNGFVAGIWFMPFSGDVHHDYFNKAIFAKQINSDAVYEAKNWSGTPIDASSPNGEAYLRERFGRIYEWGYRYFKIDGLHSGAPTENIYVNRAYKGKPIFGEAKIYDDDLTFVQCFRKGMSILNEEAPDAFLLGCSTTQNMSSFASSFGLVDAMRVGPDNDSASRGDWKRVLVGPDYSGNLYFLNNKMWYNDPDTYYVRKSNPLNKARWMVSWQSIAGVMGTSSMQYENLEDERLELLKRALPTHKLNARPIDILENEIPQIWKVDNDRMSVIGLFNLKEDEKTTINYSFEKLGLEPHTSYELFDFWNDKYLGQVNYKLESELNPASCQVIAVKKSCSYPSVISTSRHLTQGLVDIVSENWKSNELILEGTSKVVANDTYELRILVPDNFYLESAIYNKREMKITKEGKLLRASFIPNELGTASWRFKFKK